MKHLLNIADFDYYCNDYQVFKNLNLSITKGTINSIIGPNNCGKTTLIKILSGINKLDYKFEFDSKNFTSNYDDEYISDINFFIFSNKLRYSNSKVENSILKWKRTEFVDHKFIEKLLVDFDIDYFLGKRIKKLSNLDFFKYVLFTLMTKQPKLILIDGIFENYSFFEYTECNKIMKKICKKYDVTIIYTALSIDKTILSDKVIFINKGTVELCGSPFEVLEHDNILSRSGVIIPEMIDLSLKLKFYELTDGIIMNPEEMVSK